jgi:hypothetical protein
MAQMNLGQALWRLGEIIAMLKRFKITAALTKAGAALSTGIFILVISMT